MKLATANYAPEWPADWAAYEAKSSSWVAEAAATGAELLLFPEYAGMEAAMALADEPMSPPDWCRAAAATEQRFTAMWHGLAQAHGVHLVAGSLPIEAQRGLVNRAFFFGPDGSIGFQDKQRLTPWERAHTPLVAGDPLTVFDTDLGRIGLLICYDGEFPLQARALGCDLLLIPSCTDALTGLTRVEIGARARALEGHCYTALSCLTGPVPGCELMDENEGRAGVFSPPDRGFPPDGIVARCGMNEAGWVYAEVDLPGLSLRRKDAEVSVIDHWDEQSTEVLRGITRMKA